jgi:hypothetical protein
MVQMDYNSPVSQVCRVIHGRQGLGPFRLFQESRAPFGLGGSFFRRIKGVTALSIMLLDENFTVDGTLIEPWASLKSLHPKDAQPPEAGGDRRPEPDYIPQPQGHIRLHNPVAVLSLPEEDSESVTA